MALTNYEDIVINQGSDVAIEIHLITDSGGAYNLTNRSVNAMMKRKYTDSANDPNTLEFNAIVATPPEDGVLTLSLTNTQTDGLKTRGRYVYDVEVSYNDDSGNSIVQRVLEGQIDVTPSVTKP